MTPRARAFFHDWRVRTLVPVVLINIAAFVGLYMLMAHYGMENLLSTNRRTTEVLLDSLELEFRGDGFDHSPASMAGRMSAFAGIHNLITVNIFDREGHPVISTRGEPAPTESAQAQVVLTKPGHPTMWLTETEKSAQLFGVRPIANGDGCRSCHQTAGAYLGAVQLGVDLSRPIAVARARIKRNFAMAGAGWLALLGLMFWSGRVVIGRPLRQIQKSIAAAGSETTGQRAHDLDALADRLHGTLWDLIQAQREREQDIARQMVRAEQLAALGQLAAGLTHEIKNPLAGVISALELLQSEDSGGVHGKVNEEMLSELRRVTGTVDALLRLARPQPPQRVDVDMARIVGEVSSLFRARLRRQGISLDVDIPDTVPTLQLDSGKMVQLLVNLLTNSLHATDRGGSIKIFLAPFPRRDGVVLSISDSGHGIPQEHLERVFEPFFTTKEEGTGLGLAICRQIIEQHGGTITVESGPGKGTQFLILLPDLTTDEMSAEESHGLALVG